MRYFFNQAKNIQLFCHFRILSPGLNRFLSKNKNPDEINRVFICLLCLKT